MQYTYTEISHRDLLAAIADVMPTNGWTVHREGAVDSDYELIASHTVHGASRTFALSTTGNVDGHAHPVWIYLSGHSGYDASKTRFNQPGRPVGTYNDPVDYFNTDVCAQVQGVINKRAIVFIKPEYCYVFIEAASGCWEHLLFGGAELLSPRRVSSEENDKSGMFYMGRPRKENRDIEIGAKYPWFNFDLEIPSGDPPSWAEMRKEIGLLAQRGGGVKNGTSAYGGIFTNRGTTNMDWAIKGNVATSADYVYNSLILPQASNNLRPMIPLEIQALTSSWYVQGYFRDMRLVNGYAVRSADEVVTHEDTQWVLFPLPLFNRFGQYFEQTGASYNIATDNFQHLPCIAVKIN